MPLGISKKRKPFKFQVRRSRPKIGLPSFPSIAAPEQPETLLGVVDEKEASANEERFARALNKRGIPFQFRMTVGAPRGLPGWKEVDFIVQHRGLLYVFEVDTAFTHRQKEMADILHDALVLNDQYLQAMGSLYPEVFHIDGDNDLASGMTAERYVKSFFGA